MIFEQPSCNIYDNFILTHIIILFSLSIALIFVSLPKLLCTIWLSNKLSQEMVVQTTLLLSFFVLWKEFFSFLLVLNLYLYLMCSIIYEYFSYKKCVSVLEDL